MVVVPFDFINSLCLLEHVLKAGHMNLKLKWAIPGFSCQVATLDHLCLTD